MGADNIVILKDTTIVTKFGKNYLFGTVVKDHRFEIGHRIISSEIQSHDEESQIIVTKSGTIYNYENMMSNELLVEKLKESESDKLKLDYLISYII